MNVGIFLFNNVDLLDFAGPYEVYTAANEIREKSFNVFTISDHIEVITTANGLSVNVDYTLSDHPNIDILVLPGGYGSKFEMKKDRVKDWILRTFESTKVTYSVCTGFRLFSGTGLLNGKRATSHKSHLSELKEMIPSVTVEAEQRFVDEGKIMSSGGVSAGIDLALYTIEKYCSKELAEGAKEYIEYA